MIKKLLCLLGIISLFFTNYIFAQEKVIPPAGFPIGEYTPYGYIDNPYHSMILNRSGVIRSVPPLGFGYWLRDFRGAYGRGYSGQNNYLSLLQLSLSIGNAKPVYLVESQDFIKHGIKLYSKYHSKNIMSYDWVYKTILFSCKYFLARENSLVCIVDLKNSGTNEESIILHATNIYGLWKQRWWGADGLTGEYLQTKDINLSKIWAYGDIFALASSNKCDAHKSTGTKDIWNQWIRSSDLSSNDKIIINGPGPLYNMRTFDIKLSAGGSEKITIILSRGKNEQTILKELESTFLTYEQTLEEKFKEDQKFWKNCPKLSGDWPAVWKNGWVYDWETLRMNVRNPIGIFNYPWDAMQIHEPRMVLAETALDMMAMNYAKSDLAQEVIYGTFADALSANVPCSREDGSVNMIGADGTVCGTAPMWGFPFHIIRSIYALNGDKGWINKLYPYLKSFIEWWLENRTDTEGWLHCNNSWESGQDGSRRFLVEGEGDPATFVRTVDVEASMAEAMVIMSQLAEILDREEEVNMWNEKANDRITRTHSMFVNGWFRDVDGRNSQPILLDDLYDPIMLAPLTCNIASDEQVNEIKSIFKYYLKNPQWLTWPPMVYACTEAAWYAGEQLTISSALADIVNRVYTRTDARTLSFVNDEEAFSYRIPGVACEFWPLSERPPGGENYGWGAILPALIIQNIIGFRELENFNLDGFYIAPAIPEFLYDTGKIFEISDLHFRKKKFDLAYKLLDKGENISTGLRLKTAHAGKINIYDDNENIIFSRSSIIPDDTIYFIAENGKRYRVMFN